MKKVLVVEDYDTYYEIAEKGLAEMACTPNLGHKSSVRFGGEMVV